MRTVLGNVEEMVRDYPGFEAPPAEYREGLRPGDLAELMFLSDQAPEGRWAEVTEIPAEGWYRGVLDTGEWIDFGPEHVADVKSPSPTMGVSPFRNFGSGRMPERKPSIWDWEDRALWVEAQRKKEEAERAAKGEPPKRSFWDWIFRKKTAPPVTPIPEAERRAPIRPRGLLPGPVEIFEPPETPPPAPRGAPPPPEVPTIIVPPAPPAASPGTIIVPETPVVHEAPTSYFDVLGPEAPPAPPKEERGLILPSGPPAVPSGLVSAAGPDFFSVLAPAEAPPPAGGLIVPEARAPIVSKQDVFEILAPAAPIPKEMTPFDVLSPAPGGMVVAPPSAPATPFDVLAPAAGEMAIAMPGEVTPFDVLAPSGGMVVATPATPFDVLVPETPPGGGLTPYAPPQELSPFEVVAPPPAGSPGWGGWAAPAAAPEAEEEEEEEAPKKKKKKKFKQLEMSIKSTIGDWVKWIEHNFDVEKLWDDIRSTRDDDWHKHYLAHEEYTGLPATIGVITEQNGDWPSLMYDLGIPFEQVEKYVQAMDKEAEEEGYFGEAWEDFRTKILDPLSHKIDRAFDKVKPRDITGSFSLDEDGKTEGQYYGLVYYEPMSDAEREKILKEEQEKEQQERREYQERQRKADASKKERMDKLRRIWGRLPEPEDLKSWVDQMYPPEFWKSLAKKARSPGFQDEKMEAEENGEYAIMELEAIAEDGENLYEQLAHYFGLPPDIFAVYFDGTRPDDEATNDLWDEVLHPYFRVASEALNRVLERGPRPAGTKLPGRLEFGWDDDEWQFWLKYIEE